MALLARAEQLVIQEEVPIIPLFRYTNPSAARPHVHGLHPNDREIYPFRYLEVRR